MVIVIPDDIEGSERKHLLQIYPIIYAIESNHGNLTQAAKFLGITRRWLYEMMKRYEELTCYLTDHDQDENAPTRVRKIRQNNKLMTPTDYDRSALDRVAQSHIDKTKSCFWFQQLSDNEKLRVIARIKRLYLH